MATKRKIRYAVVGAGNIAQMAVLPAFEHAKDNSQLVALISGDPAKRSALREKYGIEHDGDYDDLEGILERGKIDAVYIATPNTLHKEHAIRAAQVGVHVLCEKPLAPTVADCDAIDAACLKSGVKAMVAYRLHFEPGNLEAIELARSGKLGELRMFSSVFSHVVRPDDIRRDASLAGGATLDLGVYCINAARNLFGAEPVEVSAMTVERDGTDDTTTAVLRFLDDRVAQFCISNSAGNVSNYRIVGTKGDLRVEPAYEYAGDIVHHLTIDDETKDKTYEKRDQFAPELIYFSKCILENEEPEPSLEEGMLDVRVIEAVLESGKNGRRIELEPMEHRRRPTKDQAMHVPPFDKPPKTVNAPSPSET
jgi:predicted dehydrogenase